MRGCSVRGAALGDPHTGRLRADGAGPGVMGHAREHLRPQEPEAQRVSARASLGASGSADAWVLLSEAVDVWLQSCERTLFGCSTMEP